MKVLRNVKGYVLPLMVLVIAIAGVWFSLVLLVSSNHFQANLDRQSMIQAKYLAESGLSEGVFLLHQTLTNDQWDQLPKTLVLREEDQTEGVGEIKVTWSENTQQVVTLVAQGRAKEANYRLQATYQHLSSAWFLPNNDLPTLLLNTQIDYDQLINKNKAQNILLANSTGTLSLKRLEARQGSLHCYSASGAGKLTVEINYPLVVQEVVLIEGDLILNKDIACQKIVVTGDLSIENGSIHCPTTMVYGDVLVKALRPSSGEIYIGGEWAEDALLLQEGGLRADVLNQPLPQESEKLFLLGLTH